MTATLEALARPACPRCGAAMHVRDEGQMTDFRGTCMLGVRCRCGYRASVARLGVEAALRALASLVASSNRAASTGASTPVSAAHLHPPLPHPVHL